MGGWDGRDWPFVYVWEKDIEEVFCICRGDRWVGGWETYVVDVLFSDGGVLVLRLKASSRQLALA